MSLFDALRVMVKRRDDEATQRTMATTGEAFRSLIHREMCRADRIGMECSLVAFDVRDEAARNPDVVQKLLRTLVERARVTDEIGLLDQAMPAALLPHTQVGGAERFARDVCEALDGQMPRPAYTIYTYPDRQGQHDAEHEREPALAMESLLIEEPPTWKRAFDIAVASVGLVASAPVLLAAAVAIKLTSPGPALFTQLRSGLGGRPFRIYKLRTMVVGAEQEQAKLRARSEQDGPAFKLRGDPRVTRLGRFLRKTSIDELPQLWNVLRGDMSLVGPRPLPCSEAEACCRWHRRRSHVVPGLTCIWQVHGRSRVSFEQWMRMDLSYVRRKGFLHDLKILLQTLPAVCFRRGAC